MAMKSITKNTIINNELHPLLSHLTTIYEPPFQTPQISVIYSPENVTQRNPKRKPIFLSPLFGFTPPPPSATMRDTRPRAAPQTPFPLLRRRSPATAAPAPLTSSLSLLFFARCCTTQHNRRPEPHRWRLSLRRRRYRPPARLSELLLAHLVVHRSSLLKIRAEIKGRIITSLPRLSRLLSRNSGMEEVLWITIILRYGDYV
ncbi:uncharacterized protein LOC130591619 [Beta vulgaris subsp. vulgaris]|uniref:uncharacterized protein LOC130591619 n=1 Tax=Beta vulgaris subsp. vulgaris TaxID=3555 RepID=UPI002548E8DD|nr:uncharacterized protein LOC130591619 [Beta vulgaris subsp. vulgaris]